jgi:hypothetical protein
MKPEPKIVSEVCSLCGLDWKRHGKSPTTETCIGLLLDEVRALNARLAHQPIFKPLPYPVPYVRPYQPFWQTTWGNQYQYTSNTTSRTPQIASFTPAALPAGSAR